MALRKESGSSPNLPMAELQLKQYATDPTRPVTVINMIRVQKHFRGVPCGGQAPHGRRGRRHEGADELPGTVPGCYSPPF